MGECSPATAGGEDARGLGEAGDDGDAGGAGAGGGD